ncbi:MAG TPA: leucyl aminopeptidase family protein [Alphaproteobacteria bacterium]
MPLPFRARPVASTRPLVLITKAALPAWLKAAPSATRNWVSGCGFAGKPGEICVIPGRDGKPARALAGMAGDGAGEDLWHAASLPLRLPEGSYRLDPEPGAVPATRFATGWALGAYSFTRYRKAPRPAAELVWPREADRAHVERTARASDLVRDLVNTPAEEMGPADLARAAKDMAGELKLDIDVIKGDALLKRNFPLVHAVGRASARAPRLIDLHWGDATRPKVTIIGKGVCFDTGGLDLKPETGMKLMKKDMGGAAHALGLTRMIVEAKLAVRLRVLVPAVENSVSGNAFRPLDVIRSRKGITVEIGNTDAEGRLILADAITAAMEDKPALIVDFATLTGAARVALGPELPALFSNDDTLAALLQRHAAAEADPLWRLPLWRPYRARLDSKVADINNISDGPFAGAITAALFLQEFVPAGTPWAHFDLFAWNPSGRPGRPEGAEAQTLRAVFRTIAECFA